MSKLFVSGQHTVIAWKTCQEWLGEGNVPEAAEIRVSAPPFNLPLLEQGCASFPANCSRFNVPCYGGILDQVMLLFATDHFKECAADMKIAIPEYRIDTFLKSQMPEVRAMVDAARAREDSNERNHAATDRLLAFANAFEKLDDRSIKDIWDWKRFVEQHVSPGWENKLSYDDVLSNFGFDDAFAKALRKQTVEVTDTKIGTTSEVSWEHRGLRWVSKSLCGFKPVGCLTDVVNLAFAMHGYSPEKVDAGLSEKQIKEVVREFAADVRELNVASLTHAMWIPTHIVLDCESDDMLSWCLLESIHRRLGTQLRVLAQLPEDSAADRIEDFLAAKPSCKVFRDPDARNMKAISQYWKSSQAKVSTPPRGKSSASKGEKLTTDQRVPWHGSGSGCDTYLIGQTSRLRSLWQDATSFADETWWSCWAFADGIRRDKWRMLMACIIVDLIGMASYAILLLGELIDVWWAPVCGFFLQYMFGSMLITAFGTIEEILPFTDVLPTATIGWCLTHLELLRGPRDFLGLQSMAHVARAKKD